MESGTPISGNSPGEYLSLDPNTGMYSISPGKGRDTVGVYTIIIPGVKLSGYNSTASFAFNYPSTTVPLTIPNSF